MRLYILRPLIAFPRRQRGSVAVLMVIALAAIVLISALALDGGHMLLNKTRLQNAVDAAALSGAKTLMMVSGVSGAPTQVQSAARNTLMLNAAATGNNELATAIGNNIAGFATVELASSVYGPFSFPGPANAKYVRVTVANYPLAGFFWGILQTTGNGTSPGKAVAAVATAGPSPSSPCDLAPLMVCGDSAQYNPGAGNFWGYRFGDLQLLKTAANNSSLIGPGNFQLLDFGSGGNTVRDGLAGGINQCNVVGAQANTKPGNTVGPSIQGLNTRFGQYSGSLSAQAYPSDLVITANSPTLQYNATASPPRIEYQGLPITSTNGDLSTTSGPLFDYNDWVRSTAACVSGTGSGCQPSGVFERRMLKIVVGQCSGTDGGQSSVPVLGFGCFFVLQPATQNGNESQIFGQFVKQCEGDNVSGPNPSQDAGPQIIQLYKTYINGVSTPSTDS
ncbi:pilus assembly protein [Pseudomonas frederiksbergensis]|uniref:pilus assembly protein n=1 Tax=Pseudomonas frederiksbergensis TaxID=104087 RepID=UPI002854CFFA|nr:pilus assembly protein [Pseudomonas frederiksbergensis]MDR7107272.1 Flp pilus assembly protein TadG [Pseudomonas frederiksbergensis]